MTREVIRPGGIEGRMRRILNSMFDFLYKEPMSGSYVYEDLATATTPISMPTPGTWYKLTNDGLGARTVNAFGLNGVTDVWDTVNDEIDFTDLARGDLATLVADVTVTTTANNQEVDMRLNYGIGGPDENHLHMMTVAQMKNTGTYELTGQVPLMIVATSVRDYPAEIVMKSDAAMTVHVETMRFHIHKRAYEV